MRSLLNLAAAVIGGVAWVCLPTLTAIGATDSETIGIFEGRSDIGDVLHPGMAQYDANAQTYTITAAGENMWYARDSFYFVWKKVSGDVQLTADVAFRQTSGRAHRKAVLLLKQDLTADGVYADAALHAAGMTALQYRRSKGATSQDIELNIDFPQTARLVKRGDEITMFLSMHGEPLHQTGASIKLHLDGPFYAGIGVCSHDQDTTETAVFSHVELTKPAASPIEKPALFSALQTIQTEDRFRRSMMVKAELGGIGSTNWSKDGQFLYFNQDGQIWKMPVLGARPELLNVGPHLWCDDNHGLSPDSPTLAVSCSAAQGQPPSIYIIPLAGGEVRRLTHEVGAEFHGWSPDGATIAFAGFRNGRTDVYVVPAQGGQETRITTAATNDGPDFGPDGNIYFNSDRSGTMQIWRMGADGAHPQQLSSDDAEDWFPHVSPNGTQLVYLSYTKGTKGHPANEDVKLRLLDLTTLQSRVLVDLLGGEGSLNAPSWSPDSHHLAFTGYAMLPSNADGPAYEMVPPKPDVPVK
jgi:Tol biopolymer transport system component